MRRLPLLAVLPLLLLAGGVSYVNPYTNDQPDLSQVFLELPQAHVALEGDLRIKIFGDLDPGYRLRIAREDDEGHVLLATMPINVDSEKRMSLPCGYFPRGGIYFLEVIADVNDNFLIDDYDTVNKSEVKRDVSQHSEKHSKNFANVNKTSDLSSVSKNSSIINVNKINLNNKSNKRVNVNKLNKNTKERPKVKRQVMNSEQKATITETSDSIIKSWKIEVLWPSAKLDVTPEQIQTYPERQVTTLIEFPKVMCTPLEASADFWLELLYCGHSNGGAVLCDGKNSSSHAHVLYSEQLHGFPGRRTMTLRCELFGQAGDYALTLRPAAAGPQDLASAFIKADWSDQFVLNVHGGSVFPCGEGVRVLFQYPECVLEGADRVRVFGRDGEKLQYVAERRVKRGQHTASFDCRLFTERFPEYCFVYVSQAVTGAVADVRMDCLPTLPVSDGGAGGWGPWSSWTACPSPARCTTRTRSRHRFCDSPPPAYGAKYCEGPAVELEACECSAQPWAGDSSVVVAEVGARCRCGCVLHLAPAARLLAGSARACPARSFWLLQAEEGLAVRVRFESVRLPCAGQNLKARDGDSLGSPLLASWEGPDSVAMTGDQATTTDSTGVVEISGGRHILVELRSTDTSELCAGGFLAHASQVEAARRNVSAAWASISGAGWWRESGSAKVAALALAAAAALAAIALAIHSAQRNRAYQRAADKESLTDSDACSASLELGGATAGSRSTLLSEVAGAGVSLRRLLPSSRARHTRLRESDRISANVEHRDAEDEANSDSDGEAADAVSVASKGSRLSEATVTPEGVSSSSAPAGNVEATPSPLRRSHTMSTAPVSEQSTLPVNQSRSETVTVEAEMSTSISSVSEREGDSCSEKDRDSAWEKDGRDSRASSSSAATLTNGWYSPALSGVTAARIRGNPKYKKENNNRRLLKSDLSLSSHPEMEIDYYDYEVNNAGSVPGSYLGMDPAFLVWIPPIDDGDIIDDIEEKDSPVYEEILPKSLLPDPGSNTESPEDRPLSSTLRKNKLASRNNKTIKKVIDKHLIHPLNFSISDLQESPQMNKKFNKNKQEQVSIPLKDLTLNRSPIHYQRYEKSEIDSSTLKRITDTARETKESDSDSDLKFADDSESSNDIRFADDDTPDSNRLADKYDVRA